MRVLDTFIAGEDGAFVDEYDDDTNGNVAPPLLLEAGVYDFLGMGGILLSPLRHASTCTWITLTSICFQQIGHSAVDEPSASTDGMI